MGGINDVQLQRIPGRLVTAVGFTNDMFFLFARLLLGPLQIVEPVLVVADLHS